MASPASRSTPMICSVAKRVLGVQTSFRTGVFGDADVPRVTPLSCAGDRHVILPHEESSRGAAQLIVFEEVRASRFCGKHGVRLGEGCLEHVSHYGRHRFQMHATPARLSPPGTPSHGDGAGRSSQRAQTGAHPFPGIRHQYLNCRCTTVIHSTVCTLHKRKLNKHGLSVATADSNPILSTSSGRSG